MIRRILSQARERGVSVFYLKMGYRKDLSDSGGPDSPNWQKEYALRLMRDYPGMEGKLLVEASSGGYGCHQIALQRFCRHEPGLSTPRPKDSISVFCGAGRQRLR